MRDLYKILNVSRNASDEEIKNSYKKLVKKYHPDNFEDNQEASDVMHKILADVNLAYDILSNQGKRAEYDSQIQIDEHSEETEQMDNTQSFAENDSNYSIKQKDLTHKESDSSSEDSGALGCGCLIFIVIFVVVLYYVTSGFKCNSNCINEKEIISTVQYFNALKKEDKVKYVLDKFLSEDKNEMSSVITEKLKKKLPKLDKSDLNKNFLSNVSYYTFNIISAREEFLAAMLIMTFEDETTRKLASVYKEILDDIVDEILRMKIQYKINTINLEENEAKAEVEISYINGDEFLNEVSEKTIKRLEAYSLLSEADTYEKYLLNFLDITKELGDKYPREKTELFVFTLIKEGENWYVDECDDISRFVDVLFNDLNKGNKLEERY